MLDDVLFVTGNPPPYAIDVRRGGVGYRLVKTVKRRAGCATRLDQIILEQPGERASVAAMKIIHDSTRANTATLLGERRRRHETERR